MALYKHPIESSRQSIEQVSKIINSDQDELNSLLRSYNKRAQDKDRVLQKHKQKKPCFFVLNREKEQASKPPKKLKKSIDKPPPAIEMDKPEQID